MMKVRRTKVVVVKKGSNKGVWFRINVLAIFLVIAVAGIVWLFLYSPVFEVRDVSYHGKVRVPEQKLSAAEEAIVGRSMFLVSLDSLRRLIESYPEVKKVIFKRKLFHTIDCYLIERKPVALILSPSVYGVSEDCVLLKNDLNPDYMDLPMITGLSAKELGTEKGMEKIRKAITVLNLFKQSGFEGEIEVSEIFIRDGDVSMVIGSKGTVIRFGKDKYDKAIRKLRAVFGILAREKHFPSVVDLRFDGQVVVR